MAKATDYLSLSIKLILILSILNGIYNSLWHLVSTDIFLLILMFIPQIFKKYQIQIPKKFEWLLLIFVIITLFLGKMSGIITPLIFGIAIAMIGFMILAILYSSNQIKKNYFLIIMFSFNFAVALGFAIELIKYYLKLVLNHNLSVELYKYSMQTMTFVILGALISAIIGYLYMKSYKNILRKIARIFTKNNQDLFIRNNEEILSIIKEGENETTEFKSTLRVNLHTNEFDRKIEHSVLKTITAFLNSEGGNLFIGIANNEEVLGIEKDKFPNSDKFNLHLINIIKEKIGKKHLNLISLQTIKIRDREIVLVRCKKSKTPVFLKTSQNEEEFYIRTGNSTTQIAGSELIDYIEKRFKKN